MIGGAHLRSTRAMLARLVREARGWGLPGIVGLMSLIAAAVLGGVVVPGEQAGLRAEASALHEARRHAALAARQRRALPAPDLWVQFRETFPGAGARNQRVAQLLTSAAAAGVQAQRSDLRVADEPALGLVRLRVLLPVTGTYADVRRFVDEALRGDPALSLDRLRLERRDTVSAELRGELQWSLWMRSADGDPQPPGGRSRLTAARAMPP
ncbi:MAG: hypothetical protein KGI90_07765 [Burkholderiales bacterium]|nr:hypothetical protein [Burkholderiales bacterium]